MGGPFLWLKALEGMVVGRNDLCQSQKGTMCKL
jgi:hypothetical protein